MEMCEDISRPLKNVWDTPFGLAIYLFVVSAQVRTIARGDTIILYCR
jgi:hypothetical protein